MPKLLRIGADLVKAQQQNQTREAFIGLDLVLTHTPPPQLTDARSRSCNIIARGASAEIFAVVRSA
jgi:hypothetical protein